MLSKNNLSQYQAIYSKTMLKLYDFLVLGISNNFIWRCPSRKLLEFFNQNITSNHLDVGVGTGYFLKKTKFPLQENIRLGLMDINEKSLETTQRILRRNNVEVYKHDIRKKMDRVVEPFDSISVNYLLHCIPGVIEDKVNLFENLNSLLNENGVIFGSTLVRDNISQKGIAKKLMDFYNQKGIFHNQEDYKEGLENILSKFYKDYFTKTIGHAVLFRAWK
jgi:16S rRNA G1207 methylase RsmC